MKATLLGFALLLGGSTIASADVVISYGNDPSADQGNIVFNGTGTSASDPVVGRLNGTNFLYQFDSSDLLMADANGQARVEATDGSFVDLTFFPLAGNTFTSAIFNLNVYNPNGPEQPVDGTVQFTVGLVGEPDYHSLLFDVSRNGNNFFTIQSINGERMTSIAFQTTNQLADLRQLRISGTAGPGGEVPEPATMGLMGASLIGAVLIRRHRIH